MKTKTQKLGKVSITVEKDYHSTNRPYDKLTIVEEKDAFVTYVSRKYVPIGTQLTDRNYWIPLGGVKESIVLDYNEFKAEFLREEAARVLAENERVSNENTRKSNETTRQTNETSRQNAETTRGTNETTRQNNETTRLTNEGLRDSAEGRRISAENTRNLNETARMNSETNRTSHETTRQNNETNRQTNESIRQGNETVRQNNETVRQQQEGTPGDTPSSTGSRWAIYKQAEADRTTTFNQTQTSRQSSYNEAEGSPTDEASATGSRWARFNKAEEDRDALVEEKVADITRLQEEKADIEDIENGDIIAGKAVTLDGWSDQRAITDDVINDAVRTTGGDIPVETSYGSKLETIKPVAGSRWTTKLLFNGSYNMLNAAKWGNTNNQHFVGNVVETGGDFDFVYFLVPELTLGTFGTADENNGLLFTNSQGENVQPADVYFKPLGSTVPQSLTDGTSVTPTTVSYDGNTFKVYETPSAGWLIVPKYIYDNNTCSHIAWEDWYDKYISLDEPTTNPEAVVGVLILEGLLALAHSNKYLLGVNDEVCDNVVFGDTSATITHMVDEINIAANAWTNAATGESDSQGNALYRHSATVSGIKNGGAACVEGEDGGIPLTVNGTTVSYIDTNATAPASVVFYQIPTEEETTKSYSDSVFNGSNINQETGVLPINDCSIEAQVGMNGEANITVKYAKNIVDQVAINATVDVPQIKKQVEEHEGRITELEDTAVRTGSYDASVAVGLADNFKGDTIVDAEFYKRKTGGTQSVGSGIAAIKEVRGKSLVWNQLIQNGDFSGGTTGWSGIRGSITSSNSILTVVKGSSTGNLLILRNDVFKTKSERKYLVITSVKPINKDMQVRFAKNSQPLSKSVTCTSDIWNNISAFITYGIVDDNSFGLLIENPSQGDSIQIKYIQLFDLTLMFGAGNEPATPEEFEKMFPLDYYGYNAGEIIPFAGQNLVTTGKNQYNHTSGKANLLGGIQYQIEGTYSKVYPTVTLVAYTYGSPVVSGTYYTNSNNHYVGAKTVSAYDNTKTYALGAYCVNNDTIYKSNVAIDTAEEFDSTKWDAIADVAAMVTDGILTLWDIVPDVNGLFTPTKDMEVTVVGGNDTDTMVAIYTGEEGSFEPYEKHTLPLDPSQWRDKNGELVFPYGGMHGVGTAHDYAKVDADGYIRKAVRCFRQVDLGSLTYDLNEGDGSTTFNVFKADVSGIKPSVTTAVTPSNLVCSKYASLEHTVIKNYIKSTNKVVGQVNNGGWAGANICIVDNSYNDKDVFKTAMSGVMLIYELAEPVEVELATPVYAKYLVDKDGTEEITPANGQEPYTTPANISILYAMDARGEIKNLPKNYLSKESAENMLNAMVSAGIIASYTMTWDSTNNRYAFVITAPVEPEPTPEPEENND